MWTFQYHHNEQNYTIGYIYVKTDWQCFHHLRYYQYIVKTGYSYFVFSLPLTKIVHSYYHTEFRQIFVF